MKKFVFSMQKMRDYKKQILESEKNALNSLRREKNDLEDRMDKLDDTMEELRVESNDVASKGTKASMLMFFRMQMDGITMEKTELKYQINLAEMKIEKQRRKVVKLSQEISGLDKLEEQQREEYQRLEAKENQTAIEEFLSFRMTSE